MAHARVLTIEPFETSLRENTPLTSISDPKALVEYLNQVNLKGDMVLDELKRVSTERDTLKEKLSIAEKSTKEAWDEVTNLRNSKDTDGRLDESSKETTGSRFDDSATAQDVTDGDPLGVSQKSPPSSIKSPTVSVRGLSLFSPKSKPIDSSKLRQGSEDIFSYDDEIPRLETELTDSQQKIEGLENEVQNLKRDLAVTRESTQSMVQTLEEATRELNGLRDGKDRSASDLKEQKLETERVSEQLRTDLRAAETRVHELQNEQSSHESQRVGELIAQLEAVRDELDGAQSAAQKDKDANSKVGELQATISNLQTQISDTQISSEQSEKKIDTLQKIVAALRSQVKEAEEKNQDLKVVIEKSSKESALLQERLDTVEVRNSAADPGPPKETSARVADEISNDGKPNSKIESATGQDASNASKKKSKKKKKSSKLSVDHGHDSQTVANTEPNGNSPGVKEPIESDTLSRLQEELRQVRILLDGKDAAIERMHGKLKDQDGLREEIETLRDDLVNVGQEHVEAKDKAKELMAEKIALETTITRLEKELAELRGIHESDATGSEQRHKDLTVQFEDLKAKAASLQADLTAAQRLASTRFKDLNDLRNVLQKAQPGINTLRSEAAEVKSVKEALTKKDADFKRLDSRHEEMHSEVAGLRKIITDREAEIKSLNQKLGQESSNRLKAEETSSKINQDIQRLETEKRRATESFDRLKKELEEAQEELLTIKSRLRDLEQQFSKTRADNEGLKEEVDLKSAQYASAQSLMASMRDQTAEMAVQMKEARERCESLDEEVADAHRLLGERSREGETMRRLLADVESRADARTREMKERMDTAIEERDRAEDEASTAGRRRARELEDLRNKYRDVERNMKRAEEDKAELEIAQRDWRRRREELEHQTGQSTREADEVRRAMGELRDALDESERQARDLEKQKAELRRSVEETQHRLEKLQRSNKVGSLYIFFLAKMLMLTDRSRWQTKWARSKRPKPNPMPGTQAHSRHARPPMQRRAWDHQRPEAGRLRWHSSTLPTANLRGRWTTSISRTCFSSSWSKRTRSTRCSSSLSSACCSISTGKLRVTNPVEALLTLSQEG